MIKTVIRTEEDMVMVFDEYGEQMPEYQGYYADVRDRILAKISGETVFQHWRGTSPEPETVTAETW